MVRPRALVRALLPWISTALVVLGAIQFVPFGREHPNPAVTQQPPWPTERAAAIAERSCATCHSNTTRWPWYSHVAPASWLVTQDVLEGRDEFNLSRWDEDADEADDAIETIIDGSMPPLRYVLMHPRARLSDEETRVLIEAFRQMEP